jgi:hypothetical protein
VVIRALQADENPLYAEPTSKPGLVYFEGQFFHWRCAAPQFTFRFFKLGFRPLVTISDIDPEECASVKEVLK